MYVLAFSGPNGAPFKFHNLPVGGGGLGLAMLLMSGGLGLAMLLNHF